MMEWKQYSLQESNSPLMEQMTLFHDHAMMFIIGASIMIFFMLMMSYMNMFTDKMQHESLLLECFWTMLPMVIVMFVSMPALRLLYMMDDFTKPLITVNILGHQWFWSYELPDFNKINFDSYLLPISDSNHFRLLDVDNRLILPINFKIRLSVTSYDVLHAWTIPSLGMKMDAVPGRLNQMSIYMNKIGLFFGQCSEICGMNHSFMPICIESQTMKNFIYWMYNNKN